MKGNAAKSPNVISTANLHQQIDARKFNRYRWGKYNKETYGGRCGYIKDEGIQGRASVFLSGKMISTGAKSVPMSIRQLEHAMDLLVDNKLAGRVKLECKVQNIVAVLNLRQKLDVKKVIRSLANYIYEPDNFPGIIYKSSRTSCLQHGNVSEVLRRRSMWGQPLFIRKRLYFPI